MMILFKMERDKFYIQIGPHRIKVVYVEDSDLEEIGDERTYTFGEWISSTNKILLAKSLNRSRHLSTLIHEMMEASREMFTDYEISHRDLCTLGEGITQALISNPDIFIKILTEIKEGGEEEDESTVYHIY